MKTICLKFILVYLSFYSSLVYAQTPSAAGAGGATSLMNSVGHTATAAGVMSLTLPQDCPAYALNDAGLDKLHFMGRTLQQLEPAMRIGKCVRARDDRDARSKCTVMYPTVINPSNPQYSDNSLSVMLRSRSNSRTSNEDELYYCIDSPRTIPQIKADRCAAAQSDRTCNGDGDYNFTYTGRNRNNAGDFADGDCVRSGPGVSANDPERLVCAEAPLVPRIDPSELLAQLPNIDLSDPAAAASTAAAPAAATDPLTKINQCIARWKDRGRSCKTGADDAVTQCADTRAHNNTLSGIGGALGALSQGVTLAHQGQGTQGTCVQAGAAAMTARAVLDNSKQSCTAGETFCSNSCQVSQVDGMVAECLQAGGYASLSQLQTDHSDIASNLQDAKIEVTDLFNQGNTICTNQVHTRRMGLDSVVSDIGRTLQASAICACQTSSSNGTDCNAIPTIDACQANPTSVGCQAYVPLGACTTGSPYYNAQICNCSQNPAASGCKPTTSTATTVSNFGGNLAGSNLPQATGGAVSFAGGGGGSGSGGSFSDLSIPGGDGAAVPANFAGNIKAGEISSSVAATGAGVGAGGGGGGSLGAAGNVSGTAGPAPEKGIGALFKDLKNVFTNAFGGSSSRVAPSSAKGNGAINIDRFKPNTQLRGAPQQRDIASANEKTLFELVNECANGLRCKMRGDFMVNP